MKIYKHRTEPEQLSGEELDHYLAKGWYRMHQDIFTVSHLVDWPKIEANRVWWLRYHVDNIQSHTSHKKLIKRNNKFSYVIKKYDQIEEDEELLYKKYGAWITFDCYDSIADSLFDNEPNKNVYDSWAILVYDQDKLIAMGIFDRGKEAIMSKLHFYDPDYEKYSLGKYLILLTIEYMRNNGFCWYYPGYIVVDRPRFNYKLFLGKESAEYYCPDTDTWKSYDDSIMQPEVLTSDEHNYLFNVVFSYWR